MTEVSQQEFFRALLADKRDIMPRVVGAWSDDTGYRSEWRTNDSRGELFGVSWSNGYSYKRYALERAA